ncbi:hypothetical protein RxyAA322_11620 [Rubrobacter xylanophilus]|uniref:Uncharacterized protein n=1 Tax=Rubrobacter xylanophilus TaxID=49319 RepID=A0A510HHD5_9ACTN|nr:hypothetical protein [Rubrobacter xylanophilus]BBL79308.1 hypothetical protein RxyAA322_11620 [Rubrobacter xylanophilus]
MGENGRTYGNPAGWLGKGGRGFFPPARRAPESGCVAGASRGSAIDDDRAPFPGYAVRRLEWSAARSAAIERLAPGEAHHRAVARRRA